VPYYMRGSTESRSTKCGPTALAPPINPDVAEAVLSRGGSEGAREDTRLYTN